jgi:hypothetical protein
MCGRIRAVRCKTLIRMLTTIALAAAMAAPSAAATQPTVPGTTCTVFPASNVWNMDVSGLAGNPNNATWLQSMHAATTNLHPDFGPPKDYGIPFDVVTNAHETIPVRFLYADESDPGPYPFGRDIRVEGGSDRHALMINEDTCTLYELFVARLTGKHATADSGAIFDLTSCRCAPRPGRRPTLPDSPSSPGSCATTRFDRASSAMRSGSRLDARSGASSGRRDTRPARRIRAARRWALASV